MKTAVIMDIVVAAVLLSFLVCGGRRGLFRSLAGLVVVIAALVGAGMAASTFTKPVAKVVSPFLERRVELRVDELLSGGASASAGSSASASVQEPTLPGTQNSQSSASLTEGASSGAASSAQSGESDSLVRYQAQRILKLLRLDDDPAGDLARKAQQRVRDTGVSVATAVVESVTESVIHALLFALTFAVLMLLLTALMHAMDLVLKLPGLHGINALGGALIGLAEGALVLFLAVWVLRRTGVSFETQAVSDTYLLQFFTTNTPLSVLSFL